jgi:hypothetical protein
MKNLALGNLYEKHSYMFVRWIFEDLIIPREDSSPISNCMKAAY